MAAAAAAGGGAASSTRGRRPLRADNCVCPSRRMMNRSRRLVAAAREVAHQDGRRALALDFSPSDRARGDGRFGRPLMRLYIRVRIVRVRGRPSSGPPPSSTAHWPPRGQAGGTRRAPHSRRSRRRRGALVPHFTTSLPASRYATSSRPDSGPGTRTSGAGGIGGGGGGDRGGGGGGDGGGAQHDTMSGFFEQPSRVRAGSGSSTPTTSTFSTPPPQRKVRVRGAASGARPPPQKTDHDPADVELAAPAVALFACASSVPGRGPMCHAPSCE